MKPSLMLGVCVLGLSALGSAGCHIATPPQRSAGYASFRILEPAAAAGKKGEATMDVGQPREVIVNAQPFLPVKIPVFPSVALKAHDTGALVSVHVSVDAHGVVKTISPSLHGFTTPGPFAAEFWSAVETAVKQWEFRPAEFQRVEYITRDGRSERKIVHREFIEAEFDLAFMFTATGEVFAEAVRGR